VRVPQVIAMMRTPDGHGKLELTRYHDPAAAGGGPQNPPPSTLGLHRVMFAVDDIHDTVARLRACPVPNSFGCSSSEGTSGLGFCAISG
jgi:hypothetical protein